MGTSRMQFLVYKKDSYIAQKVMGEVITLLSIIYKGNHFVGKNSKPMPQG